MKNVLIITCMLCSLFVRGQLIPQMTQHMYNPLPFNPAVVGYREAVSSIISHRNQWSAFEGTPATSTLGIHAPLVGESLAAGLFFQNDKIGVSNMMDLSVQLSYRMRLQKGKISFGVKAGLLNRSDRWSSVITTEEGDASFAVGDVQSWMPDFGAGVYYYQKSFYAGLSMPSFYQMQYDGGGFYAHVFDPFGSTLVFHTGGLVALGKAVKLQPAFLAKYQQAAGIQSDASLLVNIRERFGVGGSLRPGNSWSAMARLFLTPQIAVVYAYDRFTSAARVFDQGTHEITLTFDLIRYTKAPDTRYF
jgi:type IX secretion system PorP/SprF family membrane protein